ncbi:MAG: N-acetylmuramic acid 6-phosphate etherase [Candidatus Melainabacteria bacterium]|uniref:N-acetylmuramic acid 6-phosphate etherase n=1 Tax=Candidatus Obscuribacter phosphatis TaxID=1906157 RepID=A0A8J7TM04_9BACT|nr:N-acetylmuramic acid 6-phosphate etherase [Candidatus Obscuribacter phosphatis]MCA0315273.1 N-acetylmuramic acid 6-phosphate etherase [Candidatus Melainabacteria bacterium]
MGYTQEFTRLVTEERNARTMDLDVLETEELVARVQKEDFDVAVAVQNVVPEIAKAVDIIVGKLSQGGRLIYFGAGTSGRLGVLDATECHPTFGVDRELVQACIAGGKEAMFVSFENAEDSKELGEQDAVKLKITDKDVLVGITASGRTPYVIAACELAKKAGAATVALVNNFDSPLASVCDVTIAPIVGAEALTGSTRMKAGTAQKMVLNLLSTCTMVRLGKVYENLMVDLKPTNEKLRERAVSMIALLCDVARPIAEGALVASNGHAKTAVLMLKRKMGRVQAEELIAKSGGSLRKALVASQN